MNTIFPENLEFILQSLSPVNAFLLFCRGLRGRAKKLALSAASCPELVEGSNTEWVEGSVACTELCRSVERVEALYICREPSTNQPFFAKQSQCQNRQNESKGRYNKDLRNFMVDL